MQRVSYLLRARHRLKEGTDDDFDIRNLAELVATVKKVKEDNDTTFTLGDLLEIYYGRKTYATYDKSALQWNKFVHDFCADPRTANIPDKLKTAARLWRIVRESTREKIYTSQLLDEYEETLNLPASN